MNKEMIEELQDDIQHNRITDFDRLKQRVSDLGVSVSDLDLYEAVVSPMGYNTCDKCGGFEPSEELFWLSDFDWDNTNPRDNALLKALDASGDNYSAICYWCLEHLIEKGRKNINLHNV